MRTKRFLNIVAILLILLGFSFSSKAQGVNDVYITPDGNPVSGTVCASNLHTPSFVNSSSSYTTGVPSGSAQIGPGTIVHLCGTFTTTQNNTTGIFNPQGSGTAMKPIWLKTEPGFICSSPQFGGSGGGNSGGCFQVVNQDYIKIGGATACGTIAGAFDSTATCDGVIKNTAYGIQFSFPSSNTGSLGILVTNCTGCEVADIEIGPIWISNGPWNISAVSCDASGNCTFTCPSPGCLGASGANPAISGNPTIGVGIQFAVEHISGIPTTSAFTVTSATNATTYVASGGPANYSASGLTGVAYEEGAAHNDTNIGAWHVADSPQFYFHDSNIHDTQWAAGWSTSSNEGIYPTPFLQLQNNRISRWSHGFYGGPANNSTGTGPIVISGNHMYDGCYTVDSPDPSFNNNHIDDIHLQEDISGGNPQKYYAGVYIYGNRHDGCRSHGSNGTSPPNSVYFLRASALGEYIFNNILGCSPYTEYTLPGEAAAGDSTYAGRFYSGIYYYNNTWTCTGTGATLTTGGVALQWPGDTQTNGSLGTPGSWGYENNIIQGQKQGVNTVLTTPAAWSTVDYNLYEAYRTDSASNAFTFSWTGHNTYCITPILCDGTVVNNNPSVSYSWQTVVGTNNENHSATYTSANLLLNPNGQPMTGSPAINAGGNLTSLCSSYLAALCTDIAGNSRPATGPWTIGAYQLGGQIVQIAPPTSLHAVVQ